MIGSATSSDGLFYLRGSRGTMALIDPASDDLVRSMFESPHGNEDTFSFPVVAGGRLYLRDQARLFCYDLRTPEYKEAAVRTAAELRHAGIRAEMAYGDRSAKSQMKQANNSGASYAVLIGEKEVEGGFVTVKDLQAEGLGTESKQVEVRREELVEYLKRR